MQELQKLPDFLREVMGNPTAVISRSDILALTESIINRPVLEGESEFPDIEMFNLVVSRLLSHPERLEQLKRTPFEPIVSLLPYISQAATAYKDWLDQQKAAA